MENQSIQSPRQKLNSLLHQLHHSVNNISPPPSPSPTIPSIADADPKHSNCNTDPSSSSPPTLKKTLTSSRRGTYFGTYQNKEKNEVGDQEQEQEQEIYNSTIVLDPSSDTSFRRGTYFGSFASAEACKQSILKKTEQQHQQQQLSPAALSPDSRVKAARKQFKKEEQLLKLRLAARDMESGTVSPPRIHSASTHASLAPPELPKQLQLPSPLPISSVIPSSFSSSTISSTPSPSPSTSSPKPHLKLLKSKRKKKKKTSKWNVIANDIHEKKLINKKSAFTNGPNKQEVEKIQQKKALRKQQGLNNMRQNKRIKRKSITKLTSSISSSGIVTTTKTRVDNKETEQKVEMTKEEIEKIEIHRKKAIRREQGLNHMRQAGRQDGKKKRPNISTASPSSPSSKLVLPPSKNVTHAEIIRLEKEIERKRNELNQAIEMNKITAVPGVSNSKSKSPLQRSFSSKLSPSKKATPVSPTLSPMEHGELTQRDKDLAKKTMRKIKGLGYLRESNKKPSPPPVPKVSLSSPSLCIPLPPQSQSVPHIITPEKEKLDPLLYHHLRVVASMLEDGSTGLVQYTVLQKLLSVWKKKYPKYINMDMEDRLVMAMNRNDGSTNIIDLADILSHNVTKCIATYLKKTAVDYLKRNGAIQASISATKSETKATTTVNRTNTMTTTTTSGGFGIGVVAEIQGEPMFLSYDIEHADLICRPVGCLGLIEQIDVIQISSLSILSIAIAGAHCRIVLSVPPYQYDLNFGHVHSVMSFTRQLQSCLSNILPIQGPIGGGVVIENKEERSLAENYLSLLEATHGSLSVNGGAKDASEEVWC